MQKVAATLAWGLIFGLVVFCIIARSGAATPQPTKAAAKAGAADRAQAASKAKGAAKATAKATAKKKSKSPSSRALPPFLVGLTIFLLAIFVGFELISKVPTILHSPLMSGANAISGVTIVAALTELKALTTCAPCVHSAISSAAEVVWPSSKPSKLWFNGFVQSTTVLPERSPSVASVSLAVLQGAANTTTSAFEAAAAGKSAVALPLDSASSHCTFSLRGSREPKIT